MPGDTTACKRPTLQHKGDSAMETFSFGSYFAEINTLADLQFMPGEKPYIDRPSAPTERKERWPRFLGQNFELR